MSRWCEERTLDRGEVVSLEQCWELSKRWYEGRAEMDWVRPPPEGVEEVFEAVGLQGPFWTL